MNNELKIKSYELLIEYLNNEYDVLNKEFDQDSDRYLNALNIFSEVIFKHLGYSHLLHIAHQIDKTNNDDENIVDYVRSKFFKG